MLAYNGKSCSYDAVGNPVVYKDEALTWTKVRQLASYGNNTFQYGADGIRYKKNNTVYTLDGSKILQETDGTKTITYYYGNGGVIGFNYNGTDYYYEKNLQGDITAIYNTSGLKQAEYVYDAWGKILSMTDGAGNDISNNTSHVGYLNPFRYRGYYYDVEIDLYYLESRYYDPETGRFLNADSLKYLGKGAELSNYNLYAYCSNRPVMLEDKRGTKASWIEKIAEAFFNSLHLEFGIGSGFGGSFRLGFSTVSASIYQDGFSFGLDDGELFTASKGSLSGGIEIIDDLDVGFSTSYEHRFETDGCLDCTKHSALTMPWDIYNCPHTTKDPVLTDDWESAASKFEVPIGVSGDVHFIAGIHYAAEFDLAQFIRELIETDWG